MSVSRLVYFNCIILISSVSGIMFQLHPNLQKCIGDRVHPKTLVTGEFDANEFPNQVIDFKVFDQDRQAFKSIEDAKGHGKFSFTASDKDSKYEICFFSRVMAGQSGMIHEITLNTKHGVEAKSYDGLADAAKLKPLEIELKRLEDLSEAIVEDFAYMKDREEEMRDTNESTSSRVLYFSLFGMCCLLGLATWQVLYLRRYFKAKKLID